MLIHLKSIISLFFSKFASTLLAFSAQILIGRYLTSQDYGLVIFYIGLINILSTIIGFGLGNFWLRKFAVEYQRGYRWLNPSYKTMLILTILLSPIYFLIPFHNFGIDGFNISLLLFPLLLFQSLNSAVIAILQIQNKYKKISIFMSMKNLVFFVAATTVVLFDLKIFISTYGILSLILFIYSISILISFRPNSNKGQITEFENSLSFIRVLQSSWPYGLQGIFYIINYQIVIILLTLILDVTFTGVFNLAFTILSFVFVLPSVFFQVYLLPKTNLWIAKKDVKKINFILEKAIFYIIILGILTSVFIYVFSEILILKLYGEQYSDSVIILKIITVSIIFRFISDTFGVFFVSKKMMKNKVFVQGIGAIASITFGIILILNFGIIGAAISTVLTEITVTISMLYFSKKYLYKEI